MHLCSALYVAHLVFRRAVARRREQSWDLMVVEPRDHRRDHGVRRHARGGQFSDGIQPRCRRAGAGLHPASEGLVERRQ
jgi:hypothetical protein